MSWLTEHYAQVLLATGIILLIIDVALLGFSTFIFTFLAGSLVLSGLAMWSGLLPATTAAALWSNVILTSVLAIFLWKPLKRLQNKEAITVIDNDFAQLEFELEEDVDRQGAATYRYSGINWKLKSEQPIAAGTLVEVVRSEVGVFWVSPKN